MLTARSSLACIFCIYHRLVSSLLHCDSWTFWCHPEDMSRKPQFPFSYDVLQPPLSTPVRFNTSVFGTMSTSRALKMQDMKIPDIRLHGKKMNRSGHILTVSFYFHTLPFSLLFNFSDTTVYLYLLLLCIYNLTLVCGISNN